MASRAPRGRSGPGGRPRSSGGRPTGPARPARPRASSRPDARAATGGPQITTRAIILLAVVVLLLASYTSTLHTWWDQRGEIQSTKAEIVMRKQAIVDLEDEKARWNDPAYVTQQARERFGWVMPGEVGYRVIGSDGTVQGEVPTLDEPPDARPDAWYDTLWGSVKQAGKPPTTTKAPTTDGVLEDQ